MQMKVLKDGIQQAGAMNVSLAQSRLLWPCDAPTLTKDVKRLAVGLKKELLLSRTLLTRGV